MEGRTVVARRIVGMGAGASQKKGGMCEIKAKRAMQEAGTKPWDLKDNRL